MCLLFALLTRTITCTSTRTSTRTRNRTITLTRMSPNTSTRINTRTCTWTSTRTRRPYWSSYVRSYWSSYVRLRVWSSYSYWSSYVRLRVCVRVCALSLLLVLVFVRVRSQVRLRVRVFGLDLVPVLCAHIVRVVAALCNMLRVASYCVRSFPATGYRLLVASYSMMHFALCLLTALASRGGVDTLH